VLDPTEKLVAQLGILALIAHLRWSDPDNQQELAALARQSLHNCKPQAPHSAHE